MYRNLVTDLLKYEKITTTEAKAKEIRGMAEKMITLGKDGTLASRRRALAFVTDEKIVSKVFTELAPRYKERSGGYTRIYKLGPRVGDGAPTARIELVV
jgi:large subunit ribosomal protein L17